MCKSCTYNNFSFFFLRGKERGHVCVCVGWEAQKEWERASQAASVLGVGLDLMTGRS